MPRWRMSDRERKAILRAKLTQFQWDEEHGKRIKIRRPDPPKRPAPPPKPPKPKSMMTHADALVRALQERGGGPASRMALYDDAVRRGWVLPARINAESAVDDAVRSLVREGRIVTVPGRWPRWVALIEAAIPDEPEMPPFPSAGIGHPPSNTADVLVGSDEHGTLGQGQGP